MEESLGYLEHDISNGIQFENRILDHHIVERAAGAVLEDDKELLLDVVKNVEDPDN